LNAPQCGVEEKGKMSLKNFFNEVHGGVYTSDSHAGGILHHWVWNNVNKVDEIGKFLRNKGFTVLGIDQPRAINTGAMAQCLTRVEMNDVNARCFSVEYFDGNGSMYYIQYFDTRWMIKKMHFLTLVSVAGSIASIIGLILSLIK
jgi:hypothetical protein